MEGFSNMPIEAKKSVKVLTVSRFLSNGSINPKVYKHRRVSHDIVKLIEEGGPLDSAFDKITYI